MITVSGNPTDPHLIPLNHFTHQLVQSVTNLNEIFPISMPDKSTIYRHLQVFPWLVKLSVGFVQGLTKVLLTLCFFVMEIEIQNMI